MEGVSTEPSPRVGLGHRRGCIRHFGRNAVHLMLGPASVVGFPAPGAASGVCLGWAPVVCLVVLSGIRYKAATSVAMRPIRAAVRRQLDTALASSRPVSSLALASSCTTPHRAGIGLPGARGRSRLLGPAPAVAAESVLGVAWPRCVPWGGQRLPGPLFPCPLPELQLPCRHKHHANRLQALGRCFGENQLGEAWRRDCILGV